MGLEVTEENRTDGARIVESVDSLVKDFDMSVATLGNVASVGLDALASSPTRSGCSAARASAG